MLAILLIFAALFPISLHTLKRHGLLTNIQWSLSFFFLCFFLITTLYLAFFLNLYKNLFSLDIFGDWTNLFKLLILGTTIFSLTLFVYYYLSEDVSPTNDSKSRSNIIRRYLIRSLAILGTFISFLFYFSCEWIIDHFGEIKIDQIIYTISQPVAGSDRSQINSYLEDPLFNTIFMTMIMIFVFLVVRHLFHVLLPNFSKCLALIWKDAILVTGTIVLLLLGFFSGIQTIGYADVKAYFFETSKIYEHDYVDPASTKITFPEKKRNLIYIFSESLESSYLSRELGGIKENNLLPQLTELLESGSLNFSNTELFGGAQSTPATGFTVGGLVAQTSGVPVKVSFEATAATQEGDLANTFGTNVASFLPGAVSIGEILSAEGYHNTFLLGSDIKFAGRDKYFSQHGNYEILDYNLAIKNNWIPEGYHKWWGYEDAKLFSFAKETATRLADSDAPFNLTFLTADTHFEDGLLTEETPLIFDDQYSNVIHYADSMIVEFINWAKTQPWYENTTIVVAGDHLTMDKDFFADANPEITRTIFNLFDNVASEPANTKNRQFNSFDFFPTTLASLGVTIEGDRLGLGTNLFSDEATLMEQYGIDEFNLEISKRSAYYDKFIRVYSNSQASDSSSE